MPSHAPLIATVLLACAGLARASDVPKGPLPRTVVPTLVQLELRLDPKQARFSGAVRIEADVAEATGTLWLHGNGLTIGKADAMLADGRRIALHVETADVSGVLKLTAGQKIPRGKIAIEIAYDAPYGQVQGAYRIEVDGRRYVVTQMEPWGARDTFPGFDDPGFKQPWDIVLIVPQDDVAVANAAELKTERLAGGWKKVSFRRTEPLPSYLIAFGVGPWDVVRMPDIPANAVRATPLPLRGIAPKGQGERMRYALAQMPAIVAALEDYFAIPYPYDKLDNLTGPELGGMENAGLIVYGDGYMFADETSSVERQQRARVTIAHELAHQWFGDLVTMRWWNDLWLNEGFATWMGIKINRQLQPEAHLERYLLDGTFKAMDSDSLASTPRMHEPVEASGDGFSGFGGLAYFKGAATLSMFERHLGADVFRDGVRRYLRAHAGGNVTSDQFVDALAASSGAQGETVRRAFHDFIDQPGVPLVQVDLQCGAGKPVLVLRQQRYLPIGTQADADRQWRIPMAVRYADAGTVREQSILFGGGQARVELQQAHGCPDWLMPNAAASGYYRFALAPRWQQALSTAFDRLDAQEQRSYADSVIAAYDAGRLTSAQFVAALPRLANATAIETVTSPFKQIAWMDQFLFDDAAARSRFRAGIAAVYRPRLQALGLDARPGEPEDARALRTQLLRFYAATLEDTAVRAALAAQGRAVLGLDGDGRLHPDAVSLDLRKLALAVAVQDGGPAAFDSAERFLHAAQDSELRAQLVAALGGVDDPRLAERVRAMALDSDALRNLEFFDILAMQSTRPAAQPALRDWLDRNFDALSAKAAPNNAYLVQFHAAGMCGETDIASLRQRFDARLAAIPGGKQLMRQTIETVRACAAKRAARAGQPGPFAD